MVFRRGPDRISRGTITSLYQTVWNDDGELARELLSLSAKAMLPLRAAVARALILGANGSVSQALKFAETIADRLEGRPVQKVAAEGSHFTVFYKAGDPPPPWLQFPKASGSRLGEEPSQSRRAGVLPGGLTALERPANGTSARSD